MSIKDIIAKAKETEQDTKVTSNQDTKNKTGKDLARKVMNLDIPAVVKNYWMGKIKGEGATFRQIVVDTLIDKYGLPDNWSEDEI